MSSHHRRAARCAEPGCATREARRATGRIREATRPSGAATRELSGATQGPTVPVGAREIDEIGAHLERGRAGTDDADVGALHQLVRRADGDTAKGFVAAMAPERGEHFVRQLVRSGGSLEAQFGARFLHLAGGFDHPGKNAAHFLLTAAGEEADELSIAGGTPDDIEGTVGVR